MPWVTFLILLLSAETTLATTLDLTSSLEQRIQLLENSNRGWESAQSGDYCIETKAVLNNQSYTQKSFIANNSIWRAERLFSDGRLVRMNQLYRLPTMETFYQICNDTIITVTNSTAESLIIETDERNFLIRCEYLSRSNNSWVGFKINPQTERCTSDLSWMLPIFIFVSLGVLSLILSIAFLLNRYAPGVRPTLGYAVDEPSSIPKSTPQTQYSEEHEEEDSNRPEILDSDSGPSDEL